MKLSAVMVMPTIPLQHLPPRDLEAVSRFLFQTMRGLDAQHTRRWRRLWARVADGELLQLYPVVDRHLAFHQRHMAIEGRIFELQDGFVQREAFRVWLKTGAAFGHFEACDGQLVFVPDSLSYDEASDDEMREFHEAAMEFLRTPHALATLWPAVRAEDRPAMLEAALRDPQEERDA